MTIALPFKKVVVPCGPHDYDAFLDDNYIGSFRTPTQAQAELDRVAYEQAHRTPLKGDFEPCDADPAPDPLAPFGVAGGPQPNVPVTDDALDRAFEVLISFYERSPAVTSRAERALEIAKDRTRCTVRTDGSVTIQGSRRYQVTDAGCTCKDFFVHDSIHAGMCKHTIARELWRLAQAMHAADGVVLTATSSRWAFCTLSSLALGRALKKVLKLADQAQAITFHVTNRTLTVNLDRARIAQLTGDDGCGVRALTVSADAFTTLCQTYAAFLTSHGRAAVPVQLIVDHDTATVAVLADGFAHEASGRLPQEGV
jgi:hypothetical protein